MSQAGLCSRESCLVLQEACDYEPEPIEEGNPEKLSLALEPESASIYCHEKCKQQLTQYTEAAQYTYLIVDIGGGTVDMCVHQYRKLPQPHITEAYPSSGNDYGGAKVNNEFEEFLEDLVNDKHFKRFLSTSSDKVNAKNLTSLNQLLNETFEKKKVRFGDKEQRNGKLSIQLPCAFLTAYVDEIKESTAHRSDVELVEQELRISCELMSSFFKPIKEGILEHIKDMLECKPDIKIIYLVGGFGGSKCIETAIQEHFNGKCIVPIEPAYAVVKGAVLQKQKPNAIKSRRADATYGVNTCIPFINGLHNTKYLFNDDDGKSMCSSIFHTIIERGDIIESGYAFVSTLCPIKHNQTEMDLVFYSSEENDIFYVTGEWGENSRKDEPAPVQEIGKIVLQMPEMAGDKEREVDVTFIFSHTEIQVRAFDQTSKTEVKVVLDFLSSI